MQIKEVTRTNRTMAASRTQREYFKEPRVYVDIEGETLMDDLMNRRSRPYNVFRKVVQDQALEALGVTSDTHKLAWSQYAGCTCPCSPGFIVKRKVDAPWDAVSAPRADVWVTVCESVPPATSTPSATLSPEEDLIARMESSGAL